MFWRSKPSPEPLGVRLLDIQLMLTGTSCKATLSKTGMTVRHEHYTVWVEVLPPDSVETGDDAIRAVVRVIAEIPIEVQRLLAKDPIALSAMFNPFATLGALCDYDGSLCVGSRLSIYEAEDAWSSLHLPLLVFAILGGAEGILGAIRSTLTGAKARHDSSRWGERDFSNVARYLESICFCNADKTGFTAEYGLSEGEFSAIAGHRTALFKLTSDTTHPSLGGGLLCLLEMPHELQSPARLNQICAQLNRAEMQAHDLPPHFGAWCPGSQGSNPAYVCFLPNALKQVAHIEVNVALWAQARTQWAAAMLASLGVTA